MFELLPQSEGANIAVKASGIITESDYEAFQPVFDRQCEGSLHFRLLLDWEQFEGWDEKAVVAAFTQRIMHRFRCERLAILSDDPRRAGDIKFLRGLLTTRRCRVFPPAERDAAWSWLTGDSG